MLCSASCLFLVLILLFWASSLICFLFCVFCIPVNAILSPWHSLLSYVVLFLFLLIGSTSFWSLLPLFSLCALLSSCKSRLVKYNFWEVVVVPAWWLSFVVWFVVVRFHSLGSYIFVLSCIFPFLSLPFLLFLLLCLPLPDVVFSLILFFLYTFTIFPL